MRSSNFQSDEWTRVTTPHGNLIIHNQCQIKKKQGLLESTLQSLLNLSALSHICVSVKDKQVTLTSVRHRITESFSRLKLAGDAFSSKKQFNRLTAIWKSQKLAAFLC